MVSVPPRSCQMMQRAKTGFTLAELLIALGILGVIAAFTIPKILASQQNQKNNALAKDVAGMISGAYQKAQADGIVSPSTKPSDLIPYLNYVAVVSDSRTIDAHPRVTTRTCDAMNPCISLHGGGMIWFQNDSFGGTTNNVIEFDFDPDGVYSGSAADGPSKSVQFTLYYNGFLTTRGKVKPNSCSSTYGCGMIEPNANFDPSWFSF